MTNSWGHVAFLQLSALGQRDHWAFNGLTPNEVYGDKTEGNY